MTDSPNPPLERLERTLPREAYFSPSVFQSEKSRIFGHDWALVGRAEHLPAPGDYVEVSIAGESLLLVRGLDQQIRAFYNVCRHRGCELVLTSSDRDRCGVGPSGNFKRSIRCPYHAWTYDLDGSLRTAPHLEQAVSQSGEDFGLKPVAVDDWGGFLFVHLGPRLPHSLAEQFSLARQALRNYPLADLKTGRRIVYDVAANWKVILENYNECYHCAGVHPELCRVVPAFKQNGGAGLDWVRGVPHKDGAVTFTMSGTTTRAPFPGLNADELVRHKGELIYPNMMISLSMDHVAAFMLLPEAPDRTTVVTDFLFHPTEMARPDFDPADAVEFWDITNRQDWAICEAVQRGMRSRSFEHGYYAPMESASLDIRRYVGERLGDALPGSAPA